MKITTYPKKCLLHFDLHFGETKLLVYLEQDILNNTSHVSIENIYGEEILDDNLIDNVYKYLINKYQLRYEADIDENYVMDSKDIFPNWDNDPYHLSHFDPAV